MHKETCKIHQSVGETSKQKVTKVPECAQQLINVGDLQFLVSPDGACAFNCGVAHIFQDSKYGPQLRKLVNKHIVNNWDLYQKEIAFPYNRKAGIAGKIVQFEIGDERQFLKFLKTNDRQIVKICKSCQNFTK